MGLPTTALFVAVRYKSTINADQTLRSHGLGSDRMSNPNYEFRKRFNRFYCKCSTPPHPLFHTSYYNTGCVLDI